MKVNYTTQTPGKIILAGEHAVVQGCPALAMAVNRYTTVQITPSENQQVQFILPDIQCLQSLTFAELQSLQQHIDQRFNQNKAFTAAAQLSQYVCALALSRLSTPPVKGFSIKITSTIPAGCGMGSSAAVIVGLLVALKHYFQADWQQDQLLTLALQAEHRQHGKSSGLDINLALLGGCLYLSDNILEQRPMPAIPFSLVHTGQPIASTGECVLQTSKHFKREDIKTMFTETVNQLDHALQQNNYHEILQCIHHNHELLCQIGVVPEKVQHFIKSLTKLELAGKISGAGSVAGEAAGIVLIAGNNLKQPALQQLIQQYGYKQLTVQGEKNGTRIL